MDASPKAGPSVHRKRTKSRSSLAPPVIEPAATATAAESNGMDVDSAPTANAEASSSKLPTEEKEKKKKSHSSTSKERRRRKNAAKEAAGLFADRPEPHTVEAKKAGDATIKGGEAEIGKKSKSQRRKGRGKGEGAIWECHSLAQGNVSRIPPVWSADGRFYITADDRSIHIHTSSAPYTRLSTLSSTHANGHTKALTAMLLSPVNPSHLVTAGEDGKVMVWDYVKGDLVYSLEVNDDGVVGHMCMAKVGDDWVIFGTTSVLKKGKGRTLAEFQYQQRVVRLSYPTPSNPTPTKHIIGRLSSPPTALFAAPSSIYLIALAGNKAYTYLLPPSFPPPSTPSDEISSPQCVKFVSDHLLTCGAFAPADKLHTSGKGEDWFATGDTRGVIRLWHGLSRAFSLIASSPLALKDAQQGTGAERRLPTTSLHWHAHAVAAIAFTPTGSQLLSVGEESVLVQWHLASGKREYVPRLGGRPIVSVAVREGGKGREEEWWVGLMDGGRMKVGAASGSIAAVGHGVRLDPLRSSSPSNPYPLLLHPSTSALVLPSSHPSTLQWVDTAQSSVLFDLEVAPSNRVTRRDEKELEGVAVEKVAFSEAVNGQSEWMATVEGRQGDEYEGSGGVRVLKVWRWDGERYMVNTTQPRPHGLNRITALAFSHVEKEGERPLLLTADESGGVKTWMIRQSRKSEHGKTASKRAPTYELYWTQRSAWSYRNFPVHAAAFSRDGTIAALAHGPVVSLWDIESNNLLKVLAAGAGEVKELLFVGDEGRYLVGAGQGLISWDLFSCEAVWQTKIPHAHLLPHPSGFTALSTISNFSILSLYSPSSPKATSEQRINNQSFRTVIRLPSSGSSTKLGLSSLSFVGVTSDGEVVKFGDASAPLPRLSAVLPGESAAESGSRGIWQEMFGDRAFALQAVSDTEQTLVKSAVERKVQGRASAVFDGPSHTLPPVSTLFDAFIDEVLALPVVAPAGGKNGEMELEVDVAVPQQEDGDMDEDAQMPEQTSVLPTYGKKKVDDKEIKELESFFRSILSVDAAVVDGKGKAKAKSTPRPSAAEAVSPPSKSTPPSQTPGSAMSEGKKSKKDKRARSSLGKEVNGQVDEDEGREVGGKGRKRRAPRDSAA